MVKKKVSIVVLAGGSGKRLWPLSKENLPKQLLKISKESFLEITIKRFKKIFGNEASFYVTAKKKLINQFQKELERKIKFIIEPDALNTGPAVAISALYLNRMSPDSIIIFTPSDNLITNEPELKKAVKKGLKAAAKNKIAILGTKPTSPNINFGYLELGNKINSDYSKLNKFTEKPDKKTAQKYFKSNKYLWNSGIVITKAETLLSEIKKGNPELDRVLENIAKLPTKSWGTEKGKKQYKKAQKEPIEKAVYERSKEMVAIDSGFHFSDTGTYKFFDNLKKEGQNNYISGKVVERENQNSIVINKTDKLLVTEGLANLVAVVTDDSILIIDKNKSDALKETLEIIPKKHQHHL